MTFGLNLLNTAGQSTFSLDNGAFFFKGAGVYNATTSIPAPTFAQLLAIATPIESPYLHVYGGGYEGVAYVESRANGIPNLDGTQYVAPQVTMTAGYYVMGGSTMHSWTMGAPTVSTTSTFVHQFGSPYAYDEFSDWGMMGVSANGATAAISKQYKAFCVHPDQYGNIVRSATAYTPPISGSSMDNMYTDLAGTTPNITFDKPYDSPPLIFVTSSSGPVTLASVNRDSNGKFVSATVVTQATWVSSGTWTGYYGTTSCSFSYYIVSDEVPYYPPATNHGLQLWNSSGTQIFDGRYQVPSFGTADIPTPYHAGLTFYSQAITGTTGYAVCLNQQHAFTGWVSYVNTKLYVGGTTVSAVFGVYNMVGRAVTVASGTTTIQAVPVAGFNSQIAGMSSSLVAESDPQIRSVDFSRTQVPTMRVLFASTPY